MDRFTKRSRNGKCKSREWGNGDLTRSHSNCCTIKISAVRLKNGGHTDYVAVSGGFIEVRPDKVTVLSSSAEEANHIDIHRANEAKRRAGNVCKINKHMLTLNVQKWHYNVL